MTTLGLSPGVMVFGAGATSSPMAVVAVRPGIAAVSGTVVLTAGDPTIETGNVTDCLPAGTVTVAGTVTSAGFALVTEIARPPAGDSSPTWIVPSTCVSPATA